MELSTAVMMKWWELLKKNPKTFLILCWQKLNILCNVRNIILLVILHLTLTYSKNRTSLHVNFAKMSTFCIILTFELTWTNQLLHVFRRWKMCNKKYFPMRWTFQLALIRIQQNSLQFPKSAEIIFYMIGKLEAIMAVLYSFGLNFREIRVISLPTVCDDFKMLKISLR